VPPSGPPHWNWRVVLRSGLSASAGTTHSAPRCRKRSVPTRLPSERRLSLLGSELPFIRRERPGSDRNRSVLPKREKVPYLLCDKHFRDLPGGCAQGRSVIR
jgi:hypothetical protein